MFVGSGKSRLTKCTVHPGLLNTRGPYTVSDRSCTSEEQIEIDVQAEEPAQIERDVRGVHTDPHVLGARGRRE